MRFPAARVATTVAVVGLSALAVWHGIEVVRFVGVAAGEVPSEKLQDFVATPGLAGFALEAAMRAAADPTDPEAVSKRGEQIAMILERQPLSARHWLSLAGSRFVAGEPFGKVLSALAMSSLTGRNEGSVLLQRGVFGLSQWENLPPEFRHQTIADLAGAITAAVPDSDIAPALVALARQSEETRGQIAAQLRTEGLAAPELLRLGL